MASGVSWKSSMDGKNYDKAMDAAIESALKQAGMIIEDEAVSLADGFTDTGRLKGSITWATKKERDEVRPPEKANPEASAADRVSRPSSKWTLHVGSNVKYAPYLEYGTVRNKAQPFLRPALNLHKNDIMRDFSEWVRERLKRGR